MITQIKKLLSSEFEIKLFESAIYNLNDTKNKLRYNNFAYSIRELSRHFLHRLAPDENLKQCEWFEIITENGKPSRTQRIKYAIQGGISDQILNEFGLNLKDINDDIKSIKKTIDSLSKFTHINPETFDIKDEEVTKMSTKVLSEFNKFVERIETCRQELKQFLDGKIESHMISGVVHNYYENVDILAPHHSIRFSEVSEYHVIGIDHTEIMVEVFGNIYFTLEYGSRKERQEGDGLDMQESFPFETKIYYGISNNFPSDEYRIEEFDVDTQEWYGEITEEELDKIIDKRRGNRDRSSKRTLLCRFWVNLKSWILNK